MDFRGRSNQPAQANQAVPAATATSSRTNNAHQTSPGDQLKSLGRNPNKLVHYGSIGLLFAVTGLVVALTFFLALGGNSQDRAVMKENYQAVFLNNGQVYFGNVESISNKTVDLRNIYYLQTGNGANQAAAATPSTDVSLVKLGCELHAPFDRMLINNEQVIFWENLQDSSQVVQAIAKYKKDNTQKTCSDQSKGSAQQAPSTATPVTNPTSPTPTTVPPAQGTTPVKKP